MDSELARKAAEQFLPRGLPVEIQPVGLGLIHHTFKAAAGDQVILLQAINTRVFTEPRDIVRNYLAVFRYLQDNGHGYPIPAPVQTRDGDFFWTDPPGNFWRATRYIPDSYSPPIAGDKEDARMVAGVFAGFTLSLAGIDLYALREIIPGFHNLDLRYRQFEDALSQAAPERRQLTAGLVSSCRKRLNLVAYYKSIAGNPEYPLRVMHHDCKISNILFDRRTQAVICPVDLDTVMPGRFFSDLGDMIRSMACSVDENSTEWENIYTREDFYEAILEGYLEKTRPIFTREELANIHYSGLLMVYMQALRYLADYLRGDTYYKTGYPGQNADRARNQLILLEKLEGFLRRRHGVVT